MSEKSKRKVNPRRNLLLRVIILILLIATLATMQFIAYNANAKSAQIVFIAPDDNGIDAIWIADLDDAENPRQVTPSNWLTNTIAANMQVSVDGNTLLFQTNWTDVGNIQETYLLNLQTGAYESIIRCGHVAAPCSSISLRHDAQFVAYQEETVEHPDEEPVLYVSVYNVRTQEHQRVYEYRDYNTEVPYGASLFWLGKTGILAFLAEIGGDEFIFYDVEENRIIERRTLNEMLFTPYFSDDGLSYAFNDRTSPFGSNTRLVNLRQIDNPDLPLLTFEVSDDADSFNFIDVLDWHPDNEHVLVNQYRQQGDDVPSNQVILYNIVTGEKETMLDEADAYYYYVSFNHDGSQLLYLKAYPDTMRDAQFMILDMESGETTTLPLSGLNPHWVNGGR